jgi:hypothetical protein
LLASAKAPRVAVTLVAESPLLVAWLSTAAVEGNMFLSHSTQNHEIDVGVAELVIVIAPVVGAFPDDLKTVSRVRGVPIVLNVTEAILAQVSPLPARVGAASAPVDFVTSTPMHCVNRAVGLLDAVF